MVTKEQAQELANVASNNIEGGTVDTFRSYEEGVKDAIEWIYFDGEKPDLESDYEYDDDDF